MSQENNFIPQQTPYKPLSPFKLFVKSNFPFIESTYEALDNYGLYCKIVEYLNNVIANENTVETNVQALYNAFVELNTYVSDYFDNLDVQDEINNKLDDMVEQGTLQEIIADYLNSKAVFGFENVEEMLNASNLLDGSYARTLGFYEKNDGGGALYKIREVTNNDVIDEMTILSMETDNSLIAELIIEDYIIPDQLGAKGNGNRDDIDEINQAIQICYDTNKTLVLTSGKTYLISQPLTLTKRININGNNSTLKASTNMQYMLYINVPNEYDGEGTDLKNRIDLLQGYEITNLKFNCNNVAHSGIYHYAGVKIKYDTISIYKCNYSSLVVVAATESTFSNFHIYAGHSINSIGIEMLTNDCMFNTIHMIDCHTAIKCNGFNLIDNIHAWILNEDLIEDSTFLDFGDRNSYTLNLTNCYIDTYQYCFKSHKNQQNVIMSSSIVIINENIYLSENNPIIFYCEGENVGWWTNFSKITNSVLQGIPTKHLKITNANPCFLYLDSTNLYNNITIRNRLANNLTLLTGVTNLTNGSTYQSDSNNVSINANILIDTESATSVYNVYEVLELPMRELLPDYAPINFVGTVYSTSDPLADPIGVCYGTIGSSNATDKKIKLKIPTSITQSQTSLYVRFNVTYKTQTLRQSSFNWNNLTD